MSRENTKALLKLQTYLSRRPHSEHELKNKLKKNFSDLEIHQAIECAKNKGWLLSPEQLSQHLSEGLHKKNKGWLFIKSQLKSKNLPLTLKDENKEEEKAKTSLRKKFDFPEGQKKPSSSELQKMHRFLKNRGFENEVIHKVLFNTPLYK